MQWRAAVPQVARRLLSKPSPAIGPVVTQSSQEKGIEPGNEARIRRVRSVSSVPEPTTGSENRILENRDTEPDDQLPMWKLEPVPDSPPARKKRNPKDQDIFNLLEDIKVDLHAAEFEEMESSSNDSRRMDDRTSRGRKYYEQQDSNPSTFEQLPLSPLMHPRLLKARERFTKAKPLPSEELNEFQRLININSYGMSLKCPNLSLVV